MDVFLIVLWLCIIGSAAWAIWKYFTKVGPLMIVLSGVLAMTSTAADYLVAQTANGSTNSMSTANGAAFWAALNAGDTVHIYGDISTNLIIQKSGIPGSPITITFENGARMVRDTWGTLSAYLPAGNVPFADSAIRTDPQNVPFHDLTINNARVETTNNGFGKIYTNGFYCMWLYADANISINGMVVTNCQNYTGATNAYTCSNCGDLNQWYKYPPASITGIRCEGANTNTSITGGNFDNCGNSIYLVHSGGSSFAAPPTAQFIILSNHFTRYNWAIGKLQSVDNSRCLNSRVAYNWMDCSTNWDFSPNANNSQNPNHGDGIFWSTGNQTNCLDINPRFEGNYVGPYLSSLSSAALLYVDATGSSLKFTNMVVVGNIVNTTNPAYGTSVPKILVNGDSTKIINNTILGSVGTYDANPTFYTNFAFGTALVLNAEDPTAGAVVIANNIIGNCYDNIARLTHLAKFPTNSDYNIYFYTATNTAYSGSAPSFGTQLLGSGTSLFPGWTNASLQDFHGNTNNPIINPITFAAFTNSYAGTNYLDVSAYGVTNRFIGAVNPGNTNSTPPSGSGPAAFRFFGRIAP